MWKQKMLASLACFALLCACASGTNSTPESSQSLKYNNNPLPERVYALVVKERTNPYMQKMFEGFEMACNEIGAKAIYKGPATYTAEDQIEIIDELIAQGGVDTIAVAANDSDALEESLKRAMLAGIHVLSLDSSVNADSRMVHIQQADPEKIGRVLIQAVSKMIQDNGTVGIISSTRQATNQNLWIEWMKREVEDNPVKYQNITLLPEAYGDDSMDKSREEALRLLEEYPDLNALIIPSVVGMLAVGNVLQEQDSPVIFTGLGLPSEMAQFIESGSCPWMYLWNPIDIGYLAAYSADALASGTITGTEGETFPVGRLGQRTVSNSADGGTEILLGDPVKFDKENINEWKSVY